MNKVVVGIIMGSDSDLPVMQESAEILQQLGILFEMTIVSAHRTPERMYQYAKTAEERGLKVIIAGAGGSAHLPGMTASLTTLPVIGVPVKTKTMRGRDSLYSIVQMPPGIPVATVAINGAKNAGLLAAKILALSDESINQRLKLFTKNMEKNILKKAELLEKKDKKNNTKESKDERILSVVPYVLKKTNFTKVSKEIYRGKVRDIYVVGDKRIQITTDRQSAFDVILGHIPYKGAVLNLLATYWLELAKKIIPTHVIAVPDPNVMVVKKCDMIPVEMVVRGYITGVTATSPWGNYAKGERYIYGIHFPEGLKKNQKLPRPIITPTTHPDVTSGLHDERLTKKEIIDKKIVSKKLYEQMEKLSLELFDMGTAICKKAGLILVDTKYEFGLYKGKLMLIDEIHTPDSSRFWIADTYEKRFKKGDEPENFDKEFLRLWYAKRGYTGQGTPPKMSDELLVQLSKRYIAVYEKITGKRFDLFSYPIEKRINDNIIKYLK